MALSCWRGRLYLPAPSLPCQFPGAGAPLIRRGVPQSGCIEYSHCIALLGWETTSSSSFGCRVSFQAPELHKSGRGVQQRGTHAGHAPGMAWAKSGPICSRPRLDNAGPHRLNPSSEDQRWGCDCWVSG